jgi:hypothetical protein
MTSMDGKSFFPHLNRANYHTWVLQMASLFDNKGLWMYLEKELLAPTNNHYDLVCLKKGEALG